MLLAIKVDLSYWLWLVQSAQSGEVVTWPLIKLFI
jgi:hypothetical protein